MREVRVMVVVGSVGLGWVGLAWERWVTLVGAHISSLDSGVDTTLRPWEWQ